MSHATELEEPKRLFVPEITLGNLLMIASILAGSAGLYAARTADMEVLKTRQSASDERLGKIERVMEKVVDNQTAMVRISEQVSVLMQERKKP